MDAGNTPPGLGLLQMVTGPATGSNFPITKTVITLGREPGNDILITDPAVSRHHARISLTNGTWVIEKLSPSNTLTVNNTPVDKATIKDRDTIGLGTGTTFVFLLIQAQPVRQSPQTVANPPLSATEQVSIQSVQAALKQPVNQPPPPSTYIGNQPLPTATDRINVGTPSLEISTNIHRDKSVYKLDKPVLSVGRDPKNDIVIDEPVISGFHVQIIQENNQFVLIHPHPSRQHTTNGLLYQGRHIQGTQPFRHTLTRGDIFRIGDEHGTLVTLTFNDGSGASQDIVPEIRPIPLGTPVITLGRRPDNMVVLSHPQVSGLHAELRQVQGGYRIIDRGSANHVYVNGRMVSDQLLQVNDEIRIGPYKLIYTGTELTQHDERNSIRIDALQLNKVGTKQTILLNNISIAVPPRKFVALVGGSGAGKSTLLDALNGLRPAQKGEVLYNGTDYYKHLAAFSTQLGYVPQDDIIHRDLTVERVLYYAAKLRLPDDFTDEQIKQRIDEALEDVEMTHRRNILVSKLSGGQRKRVSIALELLANPSVFFLDEPTSGLDPGLDRKMMFLMRKLADKGKTIILVTHATNNINTCDYVCFLCRGGRLAYFGPPNEAKTFFGKTDFAEIYSALEPTEQNPNIPEEAENRFKASEDYKKYVTTPLSQGPAAHINLQQQTVAIKPPKRGNPFKQFTLLALRYLELLWNDKGNLAILLLQAPVIAAILFFIAAPDVFHPTNVVNCPPQPGVPITAANNDKFSCDNIKNFLDTPQGQAFAQSKGKTKEELLQESIAPGSGTNAQEILFIMAFAAVMFGLINGAREIVKEAPIYRRERTVNLGIAPYMFSKIAVLGVLCLVQSAVLVLVVNAKAPFQYSILFPPIVEIYITTALTSLAGLMIGLLISALAPNNDRATSLIPMILIPQVIFSGIIFKLSNPGLEFAGGFFAARWAMAGMGSTVGLHADKLNVDDFSYHGTLFSNYSQADAVGHLFLIWFVLTAMTIIFGILIAYLLKRKDKRS